MNPNALENLKDIHLPEPVSFWPPAWGWWVTVIAVLTAVYAIVWYFKQPKKPSHLKLALKQLDRLYADYKIEARADLLLMGLSVLIKQVALAAYPRAEVAKLSGRELLQYLDKNGNTTLFTTGDGKILATGPYQADPRVDADTLIPLIRNWIKGTL